jgi:hypothetical protein
VKEQSIISREEEEEGREINIIPLSLDSVTVMVVRAMPSSVIEIFPLEER